MLYWLIDRKVGCKFIWIIQYKLEVQTRSQQ